MVATRRNNIEKMNYIGIQRAADLMSRVLLFSIANLSRFELTSLMAKHINHFYDAARSFLKCILVHFSLKLDGRMHNDGIVSYSIFFSGY